ncbi:hypothetical protein QT992_29245, partial [Microcoleus sp. T3_D1]
DGRDAHPTFKSGSYLILIPKCKTEMLPDCQPQGNGFSASIIPVGKRQFPRRKPHCRFPTNAGVQSI